MRNFTLAIVGATGAVGRKMVQVVEERGIEPRELRLFASSRSAGTKLTFRGEEIEVRELTEDSFRGVDYALFSAGAAVSRHFSPIAAASGAVVIDNSSAFRMEPDVPLVVPEVNPQDAFLHRGIIANPNCSTIQMVVVLKPIMDVFGLERVVVSTYQSVSGTGWKAISELLRQTELILKGEPVVDPAVYPVQIAFNVIPHIDSFEPNRYTKEEMKMINETRKIMHAPDLRITATTVRVPVLYSHSESVNLQTKRKASVGDVIDVLKRAPGVVVKDDPEDLLYPTTLDSTDRDECFVGRIREDFSCENGINLWIVADNLRKGAATNAIQILELLINS